MTELVKRDPLKADVYRKYTPDQIIDALMRSHGLIAPAARKLGCGRHTIQRYMQDYPEIAEAIKDEDEGVNDLVENSLIDAIKRDEAWAVCFRLRLRQRIEAISSVLKCPGPAASQYP